MEGGAASINGIINSTIISFWDCEIPPLHLYEAHAFYDGEVKP